MSDKMEIYYFSPTGGTKKVSDIFAAAVGKDAEWHDLGDKQTPTKQPQGELIIVAAPVFAGRIPSVVREKIKTLAGEGKQAVTIAVYGNRAYEDALLEMNDILIQGGFTVIASAAFVAQHSIVPEVGAGRPDAEDIKEIRIFAETVKSSTSPENVHVPGNRPYKPEMNVVAAPLSLPSCTACGARSMRKNLLDRCHIECGGKDGYGCSKMYSLYGLHSCVSEEGKNSSASLAAKNR